MLWAGFDAIYYYGSDRSDALLQRPEGAAISELVAETGWQAHSVRGVISGALKKKLGLPVTSGKVDGRGTVYKLDQTV